MAKSVAERQASYRVRLAEQGKMQRLFTLDKASWEAGVEAGKTGGPEMPPADVADRLAYFSGYVEGKAKAAKNG